MSAARLRAQARALAVRVIDAMYADPFWMQRFGSRGRDRSEEDIAYHVEYVAQAIDASDHGIMARYADWLRTVLTSRGMCTRHLDESFARLLDALEGDLRDAAADPIAAARGALLYDPSTSARAVQDAADAIVEDVLAHGSVAAATRNEVAHHVSYVADALATSKVDAYARFVDILGQGDVKARVLERVAALSPEAAADARRVFGGAP